MRGSRSRARQTSGRSRLNSFSWRWRVPVETTIRPPPATAGTRYARVLPVPVPASQMRTSRCDTARSTAAAMARCSARGAYPGSSSDNGPAAAKTRSHEAAFTFPVPARRRRRDRTKFRARPPLCDTIMRARTRSPYRRGSVSPAGQRRNRREAAVRRRGGAVGEGGRRGRGRPCAAPGRNRPPTTIVRQGSGLRGADGVPPSL